MSNTGHLLRSLLGGDFRHGIPFQAGGLASTANGRSNALVPLNDSCCCFEGYPGLSVEYRMGLE